MREEKKKANEWLLRFIELHSSWENAVPQNFSEREASSKECPERIKLYDFAGE